MSNFSYTRNETLLLAENVCLTLSGHEIIKNLNLEIKNITRADKTQGQIVSLLSKSGVGKTQTLEMISGLRQPTSGTIKIGNPLQPVKAGIVGVVAQDYPLFKQYTVHGNLMLAARKNKSIPADKREEKINSTLDLFQLHDHINDYPAVLSGGQKQRVAIAQQTLCSDHFLLMDEPFSGLDPVMIKAVSDIILKIAAQDTLNTVIIVTHDVETAILLSDTLWILGRDKDAKGNVIGGANIKQIYDLVELGLAWKPDIEYTPNFIEVVKQIKAEFNNL